MSEQQQIQNPSNAQSPSAATSSPKVELCAGNCGFFGNPRTSNYCSQCWKKKQPATSATPPSSSPLAAANEQSKPEQKAASASPASSPLASPSASPTFGPVGTPPSLVSLGPLSMSSPMLVPARSPMLAVPSPTFGAQASPQSSPPQSPSFSPSMSPSSSPPSPGLLGEEGKRKKNRCHVCQTKLGINYFNCRCSESAMFCATHRYPHEHKCTFDHRQRQKSLLGERNPTVKGDKLGDRV